MQFLPDWAPNWHPLIIHFPIALILIAFLADFSRALFKKSIWLRNTAVFLYSLGTLFVIIAYITGKIAADSVTFPPEGFSVVGTHADYALYTMIFAIVFLGIRALALYRKWDENKAFSGILVLGGLVAVLLIQETAEHGAMLVYKYSVGTQNYQNILPVHEKSKSGTEKSDTLSIAPDGSWKWSAGIHKPDLFHWHGNIVPKFSYSLKDPETVVFELQPDLHYVAVFGPELSEIQVTAKIDLGEFHGKFYLIHHYQDSSTYDFLSVQENIIELGRFENGKKEIFSTKQVSVPDSVVLEIVDSRGHFRALINGKLIAHVHAGDLPPGSAGFGITGRGLIKLKSIQAIAISQKRNDEHHEHQHDH